MRLEGSCHCGAVSFACESNTPYPYQRCYCSICRKTAGGGGYAINLMAAADSLEVQGKTRIYHARIGPREDADEQGRSRAERHFCGDCGSFLWLFSPDWPELIHPFASAIDTPLPKAPERVHLLLDSAAPWVEPEIQPQDQAFDGFPDESIEEWHRSRGLGNR